jgi:hypothetical protein
VRVVNQIDGVEEHGRSLSFGRSGAEEIITVRRHHRKNRGAAVILVPTGH